LFPSTTNVVPVTTINFFPHSAQSNYHALMARLEHRFSDIQLLRPTYVFAVEVAKPE
jgi:hypothetical protein